MINQLDSSSARFLAALNANQQKLDRAQQQLTSGKRVTSISDQPDQVSTLLQARADLGSLTESKTDLGRVKAEVDTAEGVISTAVTLVEKARTTAAQGATGTATPQTRATLAGQLGDILTQLVGIANTTVEGRNIFSGDSDQSAAYGIDLTQPSPTGSFLGTAATRQIRLPDGTLFAVSKTAQDLFDSPNPGESVFASINAIRVALQNNDQAALNAALPDLDTASTYLNQQHAFYGSTQNRVNGGLDFADKSSTRLQAKISSIEDADPIQAALDLNQAILQHTASLQSRGQIPRTTLFDFLG